MASVGKTGSIPVAKHPATSVLPNSTRNVLCTVLAGIKWTICQILLEGQKSEIFCVGSIPTWQCLGRKHKRTGCCNPSRTVNAGEFPSMRVVIFYKLLRGGIEVDASKEARLVRVLPSNRLLNISN